MSTTPRDFAKRFCSRIKDLRERTGMTQQEMADLLGEPLANYKKYENRSPMPHRLIRRFALAVHVDIDAIFDIDRPPLRTVKARGERAS